MQKKPATSKQANVTSDKIQIQNYEIPINGLMDWIKSHPKVTAPLLLKVEVNLAQKIVVLGVMTGHGVDVQTKAEIDVFFGTTNFIANIVVAGGFVSFEGTKTLFTQMDNTSFTLGDLQTVIRALATIKGARGMVVPDIYFATPQIQDPLVQYVMLSSGEIFFLNPPGKQGITNIRYVPGQHVFMGTELDTYGRGTAIRILPFQRILQESGAIRDLRAWNSTMAPPTGYAIQFLSRPKIDSRGRIKIVTQLVNTKTQKVFECTVVLTKKGRGYACTWGQQIEQTAPRIPIGEVSGRDDLFASSIPGADMSRMIVEAGLNAGAFFIAFRYACAITISMTKIKSTALIIDANSLIHRAWHALPPLTAPDGKLVNAVYGFTSVLMKIVASERPDYLVACWDTKEPTYRHKARPEYKAQREKQPQEFYDQIPLVKEAVKIFGGANVELPGYEADDLLATLGARLAKKDVEVTLLTSDRDVWQVIGPSIKVMTFKKGVTETVVYDEKALRDTTGLGVDQQADFKALRGDPSDNLKGVVGIGEKTATELLIKFKNLEGIFKAAHDPKSELTPAVRRRLVEGEEDARSTLPVVQLVFDAPAKETVDDLKRQLVDEEDLRRFFTLLGFKTLLSRALGAKEKQLPVERPGASIKKSSVAPQHNPSPTAQELESFFATVRAEGELIIWLSESEQQSLFHDAALALGSKQLALTVTSTQLAGAKVKKMLAAVLGDPAIKKIGHGLKQVWHWAKKNNFELAGIDFDTEIAAYILAGSDGNFDLASLAAAHLNLILPAGDERSLYEVEAIREVRAILSAALKAQNLESVVQRFEAPLIAVLAKMEDHGILIDRKYFSGLTQEFSQEKSRLEQDMERLAGEAFNPASPQQLVHILFEVLKLPTKGIKRGKTGFSSASAELTKLAGAHPIIEKIVDYREVTKLLSTYVEVLPALADQRDRVHTTFNQALTSTGRLSSANPNLQNVPVRTDLGRKIRRGFIAPPGYVLLSCDYSQIELRIAAALAKDKKMIEAFEQGQDIHTATAAAIWGIAPKDVTKEQRRAAKAINFGIMYGQGPIGLSRSAGISFEEAQEFIARYFEVYSGLREFLDQTKALAHSRGYVETLFGRRRAMLEINSLRPEFRAAAERMAINMPVQGTAADLIKLAMIEIDQRLPEISAQSRMLLQVHDELVFEVPEKELKKVTSSMIDIMQNVEKIGAPIVVDAKAGKNWDEMESL